MIQIKAGNVTQKDIFVIENTIYQETLEDSLSRIGEVAKAIYLTRYSEVLRILKDLVGGARESVLLDVGCGCGYMLSRVGRIGSLVSLGVDFSRGRLFIARKRHVKNLLVADAQILPYKRNSFDIVLSTETLEHLPDPSRMLTEARRILKEDGVLIVTVPSLHTKFDRLDPLSILQAVLSICHPFFLPKDSGLLRPYSQKTCDKYDPDKDDAVVHRAFSSKQLEAILTQQGFLVKELRSIVFPPVIGRLCNRFLLKEQMIFQSIPILRNLGTTLLCVSRPNLRQH